MNLKKLSDYLDPLDPETRLLVEFILFSACRISAACNLKWENVQDDRVILTEKFNQWREVIINSLLAPVLKKAKEINQPDNDYVFQNINRLTKNPLLRVSYWSKYSLNYHIQKHWMKIHGRRKGFGIHAIRHTLATKAFANGASQKSISAMLGHTNPASIRNYIHLDDPKEAAQALERVWSDINNQAM